MNPATHGLTAHAYKALVSLIYEHSRIQIGADRQSMLQNRLRRRIGELELESFDDYVALLSSRRDPDELDMVVDLVSTNHTHFYREPDHFSFLSQRVIPELLPALTSASRPMNVWSAAASSGEECYTIAMVLSDELAKYPSLSWRIIASDISRSILARAQRGVYRLEDVDRVPMEQLKRYFERGHGRFEGTCRVRAELRQKVQFERINLFQPAYPDMVAQDVIFCRNVMIYFDLPSRILLIKRLSEMLRPGGYLVIGCSENLVGIPHALQAVQQGIYRKS